MGQVNLDSLGLALSVIVIFIINCDLGGIDALPSRYEVSKVSTLFTALECS
jgi:hypothetical protein